MKKFLFASFMFLFPVIALNAQVNTGPAANSISQVTGLINKIIPLLVGVAVLLFLWGVLKYVLSGSEDPSKREEARGFMIWGIVAIFVMVSVWGLVGLLQNVSGVSSSSNNVNLPQIPGGN
jgi:hypothetical protein